MTKEIVINYLENELKSIEAEGAYYLIDGLVWAIGRLKNKPVEAWDDYDRAPTMSFVEYKKLEQFKQQ